MYLGICSKCHNKAELVDGNVCESCSIKDIRTPTEGGGFSEPSKWKENNPHYKDKKEDYLEWIITNATDEWIEKFLNEWKNEMRRSYAWVSELRKIDDAMKLLRMAAELGYGKTKKAITGDYVADQSREETQGSITRVKAKKAK